MTHEKKFGLFVHWGLYALTELQEQAVIRYQLPREEYEALIHRFDPVNYDPESWVKLAKEAGIQYICFTTKHHDGFCMWDTKYSDYSIMHTPYGKDVLKQLADACAKHGMRLSLYYSIPDWHHPHAYNPNSSHQWLAVDRENGDFAVYKQYIKDQITELLTNYGPIYTLFWDIPPKVEDPSFNELVRALQPDIFINDRGFGLGDFSTPEREYNAEGNLAPYSRMTEACNAIGAQSWGYRREEDFYSYRHLMRSICKTMARGGSYLLNIGPRPDGSLDTDHAERIRRIGRWYTALEGALECHEPDEFDYGVHKSGNCIVTKKNGKSYFWFFDGTTSTAVAISNYPGLPKQVRLLNTGEALPFAAEKLPEYFTNGVAEHTYLHIRNIPVDDLSQEPVVLEITW